MPARTRPPLTAAARRKLVMELEMYGELEAQATLDKYVHVSRAYDAGMTVTELSAVYGIAPDTARRWKDMGERERDKRRREGPHGPGEREQDG